MQPGRAIELQIKALEQLGLMHVIRILDLSQKNPGRGVVLSWAVDMAQKEYELSALVSMPKPGLMAARSQPTSTTPEWTLTVRTLPSGAPRVLWTYVSGDAELIFHLVQTELAGGTSNTTSRTMFGFSDAQAASGQPTSQGGLAGGGRSIQSAQSRAAAESVFIKLEGDLTEVDLSNLLQSISMCEMTGCMKVNNDEAAASVYMEKGNLRHAFIVLSKAVSNMAAEVEGDEALLELLMMEKGKFQFQPYQETPERTVSKPLPVCLLEGAALRDYHKKLQKNGFLDNCLGRTRDGLDDETLTERLLEGIPVDLAAQKQLYKHIDGNQTIRQILRQDPLKRSSWVPALYNLMVCDLVAVQNKDEESDRGVLDQDTIDTMLRIANKRVVREDTGLMMFPIFLHCLDMELSRFQAKALPFAIAIFEVYVQSGGVTRALTKQEIKEMGKRVREVIRKHDQVAHYVDSHFVLLLSLQDTAAACLSSKLVLDAIVKGPFDQVRDPQEVKVTFGVAGVPDNCTTLAALLRSAEDAKRICRTTDANIYAHKIKDRKAKIS